MLAADGNSGARTTALGASRAVFTSSTPPDGARTSTASPPAAGRLHNAAGGLSSSSVGRTATNKTSPSEVNAGADSPLAPRVNRRAGRCPSGSTSQTAVTYSVRLSLSSLTVVTTREPSGDTASPDTRGRAM